MPLDDARFQAFDADISAQLGDAALTRDLLRRTAWGADASFYDLTPRLIVTVHDEAQVALLCQTAARHKVGLTFRAGGSSLSGQGVTDEVLVRLAPHRWNSIRPSPDGTLLTAGPAARGADINARLSPWQRKIGPDPASLHVAQLGGIVANNASGMCCGTQHNAYHTLHSLRLILADGSRLDTADTHSRSRFANSHATLLGELSRLAKTLRDNTPLTDLIRSKHRIKNTMGYNLQALLDFHDPIDILAHLMVGSEGTLAFLSEIRLHTLHDEPHRAAALILFPNLRDACDAASSLAHAPAAAVELMDAASLDAIAHQPSLPHTLHNRPPHSTALLVEVRAPNPDTLQARLLETLTILQPLSPSSTPHFSQDPQRIAALWRIRKGLLPSVGATRPPGTTTIIEDIAVPPERLGDAAQALTSLLHKHQLQAILFGHARDGNLHFVFPQAFHTRHDISRYAHFMDDLATLVADTLQGSLKAEHSTGRNMAPFLEREWGAPATRLMRQLKALLDPHNILNPGVILNDDPNAHISHLKQRPTVDHDLDPCIECGFCEPSCPSQHLSLTPRQRIVALRAEAQGLHLHDFDWAGDATCAGDSLCAQACPVNIDTGALIRKRRHQRRSPLARTIAHLSQQHLTHLLGLARTTLSLAHQLPILQLPKPGTPPRPQPRPLAPRIILFASCTTRLLGDANELPRLLAHAGFDVALPRQPDTLCCGLAFDSKGFPDAAQAASQHLTHTLLRASDNGRLPIVCDNSSCSARLQPLLPSLLDSAQALHDLVLPNVTLRQQPTPVALHLSCGTQRLNLQHTTRDVARACAPLVETRDIPCCGAAGDKTWTTPELARSALSQLPAQLPDDCRSGVSCNRACALNLSQHTHRPFESLTSLVARSILPSPPPGARGGRSPLRAPPPLS